MTKKEIKQLIKSKSSIKIDIASGANPQPGFISIDIQKFSDTVPDIVHDIETYPWPLPDNCASLVMCSHVVEHINPAKFGFINFMNEIWRIMKTEGQLLIAVPYAGSPGYWQDPTHVNPCNENTWAYFDPLHTSGFYRFYKPKPFKIKDIVWNPIGNIEVVLEKRRIDRSYNCNNEKDKKD